MLRVHGSSVLSIKGKKKKKKMGKVKFPSPHPPLMIYKFKIYKLNNRRAGYYWTVRSFNQPPNRLLAFRNISWINVEHYFAKKGKAHSAILWTYLLLFIAVVFQGQDQWKL